MKKLVFIIGLFFINTAFAQEQYNTWYYQKSKTSINDIEMALVLSKLNEVNNNKLMLSVSKLVGGTIELNRIHINSDNNLIDCYVTKTQCSIRVQFDNNDAEEYQMFDSGGIVIIEPTARFINKLRKSQQLTLELSVLGNARSKYTFNTENLKLFDDDITEWHYIKDRDEKKLYSYIYSNYINELSNMSKYSMTHNKLHVSLRLDKDMNDPSKGSFTPTFYLVNNYILCDIQSECYINVTFDNENSKKYKVIAPDTKVMLKEKVEIAEDKTDFINKLLSSKKMVMEVQTAKGTQKYNFDTTGLKLY